MSAEQAPQSVIEAVGIEELCRRIEAGEPMMRIAQDIGVNESSLRYWLNNDPANSARARVARERSAAVFDDLALEGIQSAGDPFELSKAKEAAHHYRWRAGKIAPREYGDKLAVGGDDSAPPIRHDVQMSPADAYKQILKGGATQ